jgi:uncharacterized protein (UPF0335 family)
MSTTDKAAIAELVERIKQIDNEIKLLQEDRKTVLDDYKDKLDIKAFKAALRIVKLRKDVDEQELDSIIDVLEA